MPSPTFPLLNHMRFITCVWVLLFGIWAQPASAVYFDSLEQKCDIRKAYSLVVKLLTVYASHVITIKLQPGIGPWQTIEDYLIAALLPSASTAVTLRDSIFRRANCKSPTEVDIMITTKNCYYYKNMQKAINAGAACFKVEKDRVWSGRILENVRVVGEPPKDKNEIFVAIPRGTPAQMFHPIMVKGNSQHIKALIGLIQLTLATFQLVSTKRSQISPYGYGSFAYTIIPYAFGSFVNLVGAMFTDSYPDFIEMKLVDEASHVLSPDPDDIFSPGMRILRNALSPSFLHNNTKSEDKPEIDRQQNLWMKSELHINKYLNLVGFCSFAIYLIIVGAISRFDRGSSTRAERGWFVSWSIVGSVYGLTPSLGGGSGEVIICKEKDEETRKKISDRGKPLQHSAKQERLIKVVKLILGVPTIGGIVKLAQQYIHLYEC